MATTKKFTPEGMRKQILCTANSFMPFVERPVSDQHMADVRDSFSNSIERYTDKLWELIELQQAWIEKGRFTRKGYTYTKGVNDNGALQILTAMYNSLEC